MRREILEYPDQRLRLQSEDVKEFDESLGRLVDDLIETLYDTTAIALSAPQIDDRRAVLVIDRSENRSNPQVYINPEILFKDTWGFVEESCLSLPDIKSSIIRATRVRVRAQDRLGKTFERELCGMDAVCLQHEMDHLVGKLFIDRLSLFGRLRTRAQFRARSNAQRRMSA